MGLETKVSSLQGNNTYKQGNMPSRTPDITYLQGKIPTFDPKVTYIAASVPTFDPKVTYTPAPIAPFTPKLGNWDPTTQEFKNDPTKPIKYTGEW